MSRFIPEDTIRDIRDKADIHEVISGYVQLKKSGNRWKGLCPFHQEKTPSFIVSTDNQAFHCFGCGVGGNVFSFIMEKEKVDFLEAAHILADRYNILIPETNTEIEHEAVNSKDRLYKLHALIAELYNKNLFTISGKDGLEYLKQRGFTEEVIKQFNIGFAPDSWDYVIKQARIYDYTEEELIVSGLVVKKEENKNIYDRFRNRIIFPIWNERSKIIAFSARTIEKNPTGGKYVNSPETPIFKKSRVLYALPIAKPHFLEKKFAILCEGQIDVIAMHRAGFNNTVAPQGTAFTEEQARLLKRYTNTVYICFDGDTAGINATLKAIDIFLPLNIEVKVIPLPSGEDPDTIFNKYGKEKIEEYINKASEFFTFIFDHLQKEINILTPHGKSKMVNSFIKTILKIENSVLRTSYASVLANKLSIPESTVFSELNKTQRDNKFRGRNTENYKKAEIKEEKEDIVQIKPINTMIAKAEEELLELAILHGDVGRRLEEELPHDLISETPIGNALNIAISQTINGEWEYIKEKLNFFLNEKPDKTLTKILAAPTEYPKSFDYNKAVFECLSKIKKHFLNIKITELMTKLKVSTNEERQNLLKEITELQKEKLKTK
jgi:DNA primase